jgi:nitrogen fixation protein NifZ
MLDARTPRFQWGQRVAATCDLANDGSHPERPEAALLASRGEVGEVVQVGHHVEANLPVYLVDFAGLVVGCLEEEIELAVSDGVGVGDEARAPVASDVPGVRAVARGTTAALARELAS